MSPQTFIMIGSSGSGKGTQGKLIAEYFRSKDSGRELYYLETGEKFREFIKGQKYSNQLARRIYDDDGRQPDFLAIWMWSNLFISDIKGDEHLIADGVCRSLPEAEVFHTALNFYGRKANVVYLNVSREWSQKMLLARGRFDDANLDKIHKRLDWFDKDVMPAVEYYRSHPDYNFIEIIGERPIEEVSAEIIEKIKIFE